MCGLKHWNSVRSVHSPIAPVSLCGGLNILYGPNEAGKKFEPSERSVVCSNGIPAQCRDNFLHPYDKLRLAARLVRHDGEALEFCRRETGGKARSAMGATQSLLMMASSTPISACHDEAFFLSVFGIDHVRLRQFLLFEPDVYRRVLCADAGRNRTDACGRFLISDRTCRRWPAGPKNWPRERFFQGCCSKNWGSDMPDRSMVIISSISCRPSKTC